MKTISLVYIVLVGLLKWGIKPPISALIWLAGTLLGIFFLDGAEKFFHLSPSPFRSIVFAIGFAIVSFFIVSSSDSLLAKGLVLSIYLILLLRQLGEWQVRGNVQSWYEMVTGPVSSRVQLAILVGFFLLFFVETYLFIV